MSGTGIPQGGPALPGDLQTPLGINPNTGGIAVDQQRNQMLASIAKFLSVWVSGGTITGNLAVTGTITPNSVKGIVGTITNDNAQAGSVGEEIESSIASGSAVSLINITSKTITSIALSSGDWNVWAYAGFTGGATTVVTALEGSISLVNNTTDNTPGRRADMFFPGGATVFNTLSPQFACGQTRISIAAPTTIYLVANAAFTTSTCSGFGLIGARRVR